MSEKTASINASNDNDSIQLIVPDVFLLSQYDITYTIIKRDYRIEGCRICETINGKVFKEDPKSFAIGTLVSLTYSQILKYQRLINLSHFNERNTGDCLYYTQSHPYEDPLLFNDLLKKMIIKRKEEWSLIPDIYVSVPVRYDSRLDLKQLELNNEVNDEKTKCLIKDLDFRTHFEAGIPRSSSHIDDLAGFKQRISRYYLGKFKIQISLENNVDNYDGLGEPISPPTFVDMYISIDKKSKCAVLTWYSLSAPFLLSHLMDNVIRNQLQIIKIVKNEEENKEARVNFFDYLNDRYGLVKCGTSKIYALIPDDKDCLNTEELASLIAGETIFPKGEDMGRIIDPEILNIVSSKNGMGQYDRAYVCAYTNVVLEFSRDFRTSLYERMLEESIILFYMELILIEEAAIHIADREITRLFTSSRLDDPVEFLKKVDTVMNDFAGTIDFWDIQVNYPTSQKSINMLRNAFKIKAQLEYLQRDREQLQTSFNIKSNIIDREDTKRMDTSLAIISVLAIISAWLDAHDYLNTWKDIIPGDVIHVLQITSFLIILGVGCYCISHLFGRKLDSFIRKNRKIEKRDESKDKSLSQHVLK